MHNNNTDNRCQIIAKNCQKTYFFDVSQGRLVTFLQYPTLKVWREWPVPQKLCHLNEQLGRFWPCVALEQASLQQALICSIGTYRQQFTAATGILGSKEDREMSHKSMRRYLTFLNAPLLLYTYSASPHRSRLTPPSIISLHIHAHRATLTLQFQSTLHYLQGSSKVTWGNITCLYHHFISIIFEGTKTRTFLCF